VAKGSVLTTLKGKGSVEGLAFSPDGEWLAVAASPSIPAAGEPAEEPAELVVFDIPAFTARFTAKARVPEGGFIDLAWSADSKSLHAIDGPVNFAAGTAEVRRWAVPAFTEHQHAIRATQDRAFTALAVSPDGRTLAVSERIRLPRVTRLIRLFDLGEGTERLSFQAGDDIEGTRLGFTPDGKAVGAFDRRAPSWWDLATGHPARPGAARFASQPAGLRYIGSWSSLSPDGGWQARGYEKHRGLGDLGWDNRDKEFGTFIDVTERATAKTRTWRVSKAQLTSPAVAFSPDGTKLAGTVWQPGGASILIFWAAPK
jgi:WD40 repeat protein